MNRKTQVRKYAREIQKNAEKRNAPGATSVDK